MFQVRTRLHDFSRCLRGGFRHAEFDFDVPGRQCLDFQENKWKGFSLYRRRKKNSHPLAPVNFLDFVDIFCNFWTKSWHFAEIATSASVGSEDTAYSFLLLENTAVVVVAVVVVVVVVVHNSFY